MSKSKSMNCSTGIDVPPSGAPEISHFEEGELPMVLKRPRFPLTVWTTVGVPVAIDPSGLWSKALIDTMYAVGKP